MNSINRDDTGFDDQLSEFIAQAEADLLIVGITYDNIKTKAAYEIAILDFVNIRFNSDDKSNRDFLQSQYDQLLIDLKKEISL